jgi:hypothetical protein
MQSVSASIFLCTYLLSFFLCICHDLWKKTIPLYLFTALLLLGIPAFCFRIYSVPNPFSVKSIAYLMLSFVPGLFLIFLSLFSGEAIGMGDSLFFLLSGCYLSFLPLLLSLIFGLFTAGLISMGLISYGKWKGKSMRNRTIPFLPCMLPALPIFLKAFPKI